MRRSLGLFIGWHGLELPENTTVGNPMQRRGDPKLEALGLAQDQKSGEP
jgi:hypothetical protein